MDFKKINFKQPKYIFPLILLPVILFLGFQTTKYMDKEKKPEELSQDLSLNLGETQDSILSKNAAYDDLFERGDGRSMLDGIDKDEDSLQNYSDNLDDKQKRYIDSIKMVRSLNSRANGNVGNESYYKQNSQRNFDEKDFQRSAEMIRMLNNESNGSGQNPNSANQNSFRSARNEVENDPVKMLKKQMLMMDSLEKAKDPEYQSALAAENKIKMNKEKMAAFLNSTLRVDKSSLNPSFNSIAKKNGDSFIKAVIDENTKGYLGSRIRFRLLEDINVGKHKINKGTILYGQISGFAMQRVNLNVISILKDGNILPVNLSVFDMDGMQGLYVPASDFREMLREMGSNSVQGTQMDKGGESFFTSLFSSLFSSTSKTISNMIRQNKAKLKYNSYIYLINDKELKKNTND
ncbi:conjugative transposon protein TraM [Chryseobacterium koreense]|uniref:Conjugal transfer protein TraM n=1 Tax=Chryseobacterium koreense CCUG 49689 TaxID=1304281 RepID=A0A0J7J2H1_9FLAO|nr:conjugative transposon protein TraM [Chryseobacterium koreense]KMQ72251.1 conjugal transfer protein TraM [Chryseobacterium koreense CCUG 49689]MBB5334068.1 conjugative transposon TraM protein [Chryseobacterium koreense]